MLLKILSVTGAIVLIVTLTWFWGSGRSEVPDQSTSAEITRGATRPRSTEKRPQATLEGGISKREVIFSDDGSVSFDAMFGEPDANDVILFKKLVRSGYLTSKELFDLAESCPHDGVRKTFNRHLFAFLGESNDLDALAFIDSISRGRDRDSVASYYLGSFQDQGSIGIVMDWIVERDFDEDRVTYLNDIKHQLYHLSAGELKSQLSQVDGKMKKELFEIYSYKIGAAVADEASFVRNLELVKDGSTKAYLTAVSNKDNELLANLVRDGVVTGQVKSQAGELVAHSYSRENPAKALSFIAEAFADSGNSANLSKQVINHWLIQNPEAATTHVQSMKSGRIQEAGADAIINFLTLRNATDEVEDWKRWKELNYSK